MYLYIYIYLIYLYIYLYVNIYIYIYIYIYIFIYMLLCYYLFRKHIYGVKYARNTVNHIDKNHRLLIICSLILSNLHLYKRTGTN